MANDVIINPDELDAFIRNLDQFNRQTEAMMKDLNRRFEMLGETWRDQAYARFGDEYVRTMVQLRSFIVMADAHIPALRERSRRARHYLDLR